MHNTRVTSSDVAATHSQFNTVAQQLRFVVAYREQNTEYAPVSSRTPGPAGADRPDGRQRRPLAPDVTTAMYRFFTGPRTLGAGAHCPG
jgi:hypothetical protein